MGRSPSSSSSSASSASASASASASWDENGLKRGPWTPEEDDKLVGFIERHGHGSWRSLPKLAGLNRCGKSCRLRWTNYLRPDIKRGNVSQQEEQTILNLHSILGNKWSAIASHLPGRTDNEIKNFWNTHLKKKLIQMGFDPITHRPTTRSTPSNVPHLLPLADLQTLLVLDLPPLEQQEALQMATLEYLHRLLQLPPSPLTATFQPLQYDPNMSTPFAHLPDMEFCEASNDPTTAAHRGPDIPAVSGQDGASMWVPSSSSNAIPPPPPPPVGTNSTLINSGEICSSASNAESEADPSAWADLGGLFFVQ